MDEDEYVETSDVEELEEAFWSTQKEPETVIPQAGPSTIQNDTRTRDEEGPPRKRIKLGADTPHDARETSPKVAPPSPHPSSLIQGLPKSNEDMDLDEDLSLGPEYIEHPINDEDRPITRASPDPLLLQTQPGPFSSPASLPREIKEDETSSASDGLFTPPQALYDLPPSTSRSPTRSPTLSHTRRSQSVDPLSLFEGPSSPTMASRSSQPPADSKPSPVANKVSWPPSILVRSAFPMAANTSEATFPPDPPSPASTSSPLELPSSPLSDTHVTRSPSPSVAPANAEETIVSATNGDPAEMEPVIPEDTEGLRYSLRQRKPRQKNPFTLEQKIYENQLKRNPEAIVKNPRDGRKRSDHPESYEEDAEESQWQEEPQHPDSSPQRSPGVNGREITSLLPSLPESDDEESEEIRALRKEARRLQRQEKQKAKERQAVDKENQRPPTAKPFPLSTRPSKRLKTRSPSPGQSPRRPRSPSPGYFANLYQYEDDVSMDVPIAGSSRSPLVAAGSQNLPEAVPEDEDMQLDLPDALEEESASEDEQVLLNTKQAKALGRMWPKSMIKNAATQPKKKQATRRSSTPVSDSEEPAPLKPGQSRKIISKQPRDRREIKGDAETSSSEEEAESERGPIDINSDSDCVDHEETQHFLDEWDDGDVDVDVGPSRPSYRRTEAPLIDWMLAGQRKIGAKRKPRANRRTHTASRRTFSRSESSYKLDIVTGGVKGKGREKQTLLDFRPVDSGSRSSGGHDRRRSPSRGKKRKTVDVEDYEGYSDYDGYGGYGGLGTAGGSSSRAERRNLPATSARITLQSKEDRKQREKKRREKAKTRGHYFFPIEDLRMESRQRRDGKVTIDLENTDILTALKPAEDTWATYLPPAPKPSKKRRNVRSSRSVEPSHRDDDVMVLNSDQEDDNAVAVKKGEKTVWGRFRLVPLPPGFSFKPETSIKKQYLSNLLNTISSATPVPMPMEMTRQGVTLDPTKGVVHLRQVIANIFKGFYELAELPRTDGEQELSDWQALQRAALQMVSSLREQTDPSELMASLEEEVQMQVAHGRKSDLVSKYMENPAFSYIWFAVELASRLKLPDTSTTLREAVQFLAHALMGYGIRQTMRSIDPERENRVEGLPVNEWTAELWVNLYYLLDQWPKPSTPGQIHPFWAVVQAELRLVPFEDHLAASETIWHTVISLCILTQFSKHGMVTSSTHGAPCWDVVVLAEQRIRFQHMGKDENLSRLSLNQRDGYITLHLLRCFYLSEHWNWPLTEALRTELFTLFGQTFRSRQFTKLRGEEEEYPSFMIAGDWNLLLKHEPDDTAFCMFVKLAVQAVHSILQGPKSELTSAARKVVSLATPLGSLPYSKDSDARVDLSMYVNRLTVIAAVIYLDPTQIKSRIEQARDYVKFAEVNHSVRNTVIRGVMMLGRLLIKYDTSRKPITEWIESIATVLVDDHKSLKNQPTVGKELSTVHTMTFALVLAVGGILEAMGKASEYPNSDFIMSLTSILSNQGLTDSLGPANCIRQLLLKVMAARSQVVPKPQRPPIASDTQESQDEFADMDWGLDLAHVPLNSLDGTADYTDQERALALAIEKCGLLWTCWRQVSRLIRDKKEHLAACAGGSFDSWMECWVWCADLMFLHRGGKKWHEMLFSVLEKNGTKDVSALRRYRIEVRLMSKLLKLNPMTYPEFKDRYLEALMVCLASINTQHDLDREFVDFLLEIDGCRHPLLLGCQRDGDNQQLGPSTAEYLKLRRAILETVFNNLSTRLLEESMTDSVQVPEDNKKYVGFLITMFKAMEARVSELGIDSDERRAFVTRCRDVFQMLQKHQVLRSHSRLTFWVDWERSLG